MYRNKEDNHSNEKAIKDYQAWTGTVFKELLEMKHIIVEIELSG